MEQAQSIVADYKAGVTLNQLAAKYHRRNTVIRRTLTENGVRILGMGEGAKKHTLNETYFDVIDTVEKAYVLGFIYADGCVYLPPKRPKEGAFMLNLQRRDIEMFRFIQKAIGSSHPLYNDTKARAYRLIISNRRFCESLMRAGVTPRKSLTLEFPPETIVPKALRPAFILGYFDGDGSVSCNDQKGYWSFGFIGTWGFMMSLLEELDSVMPLRPQLPYKQMNTPENVFKIGWAGRHHGKWVKSRAIWHIYNYLYAGHSLGLKRKRDRMTRIVQHYIPKAA